MSNYDNLAKEEQIKAAYNEYIKYLFVFDELEEGGKDNGGGASRRRTTNERERGELDNERENTDERGSGNCRGCTTPL